MSWDGLTKSFATTLLAIGLLASCAAPPAPLECLHTASAREALDRRSEITNALIGEIDEHRYDDCGASTECSAQIGELAAAMNAADDELLATCPDFDRWREGLDSLVDPREVADGTLEKYSGDERREALHDYLVESGLHGVVATPNNQRAILTMGAPGSGKSYVLNHLGLCQDGVVLVDPDEMKKRLVEYRAAIAADDKLAADRVHRESSMLAKRLRDNAISAKLPICIDGVLSKRESAIELITRLQDNGYHVTLVAAQLPFDVAYARVVSRGEETGRFVPYRFAKSAHANIEAHADELLSLVDEGFLYDTNQPYGSPPLLIRHYSTSDQNPTEPRK